jgi:hypothetical protein
MAESTRSPSSESCSLLLYEYFVPSYRTVPAATVSATAICSFTAYSRVLAFFNVSQYVFNMVYTIGVVIIGRMICTLNTVHVSPWHTILYSDTNVAVLGVPTGLLDL